MSRATTLIVVAVAFSIVFFQTAVITRAAEPLAPLSWKHVGNTVEIHSYHYQPASDNKRRVIRIVDERLATNRDQTREEILAAVDYVRGTDENGVSNFRPDDSFRRQFGGGICWVLDGEVGAKLEEMTPLGVVYFSGDQSCGPIIKHYMADILWQPARSQYLLLLGMSCSDNLTIAIFPIDLDRKLDVKPFDFVSKHPIRFDDRAANWPAPLPPITELRTKLPDGMCDVMNIRAVPELLTIPNQIEERNLLISGWNTRSAGDTCNSVTYRYRLRQRKWTQITFDKRIELPVTMKKTGIEKLDTFLDTFPHEDDPGGVRGTRDPLDPVPDPDSSPPEKADDK